MKAANDLMQAKQFAEAAKAFEAIVSTDPENAAAWYQLASARYYLKDYPASAAAYEKNIAIAKSPFAVYNLACVYSLMGKKDEAVKRLTEASDDPKMILAAIDFSDPDFANIRSDERFVALHDRVDRKVRPCIYLDKARELDFWVGEWEVYNPQGRHDGSSRVESFANGCGVLENWMGTIGGDGKSINFYDPADGKWYQTWVGGGGGVTRYSGSFHDGAMRFEAESAGPNGSKFLNRLSFTKIDDNTVRQFAESSADGGKTWTVGYNYKYVRRKPAATPKKDVP
jgi:tetratricopeptide (TPR) repeat protein